MATAARCNHGDGVTVSIGGVPVDPCVYKEIQTLKNVTVHVYKCVNCGKLETEWERQENTEEITDEGMEE